MKNTSAKTTVISHPKRRQNNSRPGSGRLAAAGRRGWARRGQSGVGGAASSRAAGSAQRGCDRHSSSRSPLRSALSPRGGHACGQGRAGLRGDTAQPGADLSPDRRYERPPHLQTRRSYLQSRLPARTDIKTTKQQSGSRYGMHPVLRLMFCRSSLLWGWCYTIITFLHPLASRGVFQAILWHSAPPDPERTPVLQSCSSCPSVPSQDLWAGAENWREARLVTLCKITSMSWWQNKVKNTALFYRSIRESRALQFIKAFEPLWSQCSASARPISGANSFLWVLVFLTG